MNCISCSYKGLTVRAAKNRPTCASCIARAAIRGMGSHGLPWAVRVFGRSIITSSGCWEYHKTDPAGYGIQVMVDGRRTHPHRLVLIGTQGPPAVGEETDHLCHNRACVRPTHLRWATHLENARTRRSPCMSDEEKRKKRTAYQRDYWAKHRDHLNTYQKRRRAKLAATRQTIALAGAED